MLEPTLSIVKNTTHLSSSTRFYLPLSIVLASLIWRAPPLTSLGFLAEDATAKSAPHHPHTRAMVRGDLSRR